MQKLFRTLACAALVSAIAGCGLVYKPVVQQGNLLTQATLDKLKPGMTKRQVVVLMGSPSVTSPFDHDRWDYVQTTSIRGAKPTHHALTLYFSNGVLARTEGQFYAQNAKKEQKLLEQAKKYHTESPESGARGDKNRGGDSSDGS
jgi:outer membrane protein assembly factor BamE